ncbi:hypothetical protein QTP88_010992 [Uroleucon formosanum]
MTLFSGYCRTHLKFVSAIHYRIEKMNRAMTNEELLSMLENSDDDFGLSSSTDLEEGDSGDDDVDPESIHPIMHINITEQEEEDNISDTPIPSTSGYTWSNRKPTMTPVA